MADHDPLCPLSDPSHFVTVAMDGTPFGCDCALIARVRADERATAQVQACDAHISQVRWAEAVAAKLVEVICDDEHWRREAVFTVIRRLIAERDAARAEVAVLRLADPAKCNHVSEVLADLRAKVQAERDRHAPGRAHDRGVPYPCRQCDALEFVLTLIDKEAQHG